MSKRNQTLKDILDLILHENPSTQDEIAEKLVTTNYKGSRKKILTYKKLLFENANFKRDYKEIYKEFLESEFFRIKLDEKDIKKTINKDTIEVKYIYELVN